MEVLEAYCSSLLGHTQKEENISSASSKKKTALEQYKHEYFDEPQSFGTKRGSPRRKSRQRNSSRAKLLAGEMNPLTSTLKDNLSSNTINDKQKTTLALQTSVPDAKSPGLRPPTITAFVCNKGGTGKTTACINVAGWLANKGKKVLVVDLDPQGSSSSYLASKDDYAIRSSDLLQHGELEGSVLSEPINNISIVPADSSLLMTERDLQINQDSPLLLKEQLSAFTDNSTQDYDYIFLDTPAGMGMLSVCAAVSADNIILPIDNSSYTEDACSILLDLFTHTEQYTQNKPELAMVLLKQQPGNYLEQVLREDRRRIAKLLKKYTKDELSIVAVPHSASCQRAARAQMTLADYAPLDGLSRAFHKAAKILEAKRAEKQQIVAADNITIRER